MKKSILFIILLSNYFLYAQNVGIGTTMPNPSAILELKANDKGLLPPRLTSLERNGISNPATGLMVYDTDLNGLFLFNGTRWVFINYTNAENVLNRINNSYTFSDPQFLQGYTTVISGGSSGSGYVNQSVSISENLIVSSIYMTKLSSSISLLFGINRNGHYSELTYLLNQNPPIAGSVNVLACFDADSLEQNIYAVINAALFKLDINNTANITKIADSLGNVAQVKVLSSNDVIITTDINNGSLIKILANGTKQTIASNLRFPNYFDVFNNNYFITGLNALTGTVKKITQAGIVSNLISDIIAPKSIVFERNGNFVLQTNLTLGSNIFIKYDLYNALGQLIGPVNDAGDNPILTINTANAPLYVDNFNNLVFIHNGSFSSTTTPNPAGLYGVWILKMTKL